MCYVLESYLFFFFYVSTGFIINLQNLCAIAQKHISWLLQTAAKHFKNDEASNQHTAFCQVKLHQAALSRITSI